MGLRCDLIWKRGSSSACPCQVLALGGLRSTWSACEMFMRDICGAVAAVLPTHKGLDLDLGQIPLMDLVPRAAYHLLAVNEGGEGCRVDNMTPWWDAGVLSPSAPWGTWDEKRMSSPVPSLLEGLAWVGGLIPELVVLGGAEHQPLQTAGPLVGVQFPCSSL